jgi:hypothetical protein
MFSLTLVQNSNEVLDNLAASDKKLEDLNNELGGLTNQYLANNHMSSSFFDLNNIYFWVVLGSLVLLAFGLILLLRELGHGGQIKVKSVARQTFKKALVKELEKLEPEPTVESEPVVVSEVKPEIKKPKSVKIKVVKVK